MYSTSHLVVDGYVRSIEQNICKQIIPDVIRIEIIKYYVNIAKKIWWLRYSQFAGNQDINGIFITPDIDIQDINTIYINETDKKYKIKLYDIYESNVTFKDFINGLNGGICCETNVIFPKNKIISELQIKEGRDMSVMFECEQDCFAKIFYRYDDIKKIIGYQWTLPSLKKKYTGCTPIYSSKYGLIVIGGNETSRQFMNIHRLSFETNIVNDNNKWKWKNISKTDIARQYVASCIINDDKLLFVTGGYQFGGMTYSQSTVGRPAMKRTECFNFKTNNWILLKNAIYPRQKTSIYYDKIKQNIFVVGGNDGYGYCSNKFESYDITKNKWYRLPTTNKKHGNYPICWYQENKSLFCVSSLTAFNIECIDLRDNNQSKWNIICPDLQNLFDTKPKKLMDVGKAQARIFKF